MGSAKPRRRHRDAARPLRAHGRFGDTHYERFSLRRARCHPSHCLMNHPHRRNAFRADNVRSGTGVAEGRSAERKEAVLVEAESVCRNGGAPRKTAPQSGAGARWEQSPKVTSLLWPSWRRASWLRLLSAWPRPWCADCRRRRSAPRPSWSAPRSLPWWERRCGG